MIDLQRKALYMIQKLIVLEGEYIKPQNCQDEETKIRQLADDVQVYKKFST